ncbi:carbohydrate-binding family 9-like protein [Flavitalea flava]
MKSLIFVLSFLISGIYPAIIKPAPDFPANPSLMVKKCTDFDITGKGNNPEWNKADWNSLIKLDSGGRNYESRFKILYSPKGIYLLFEGQDDRITTSYDKDFENLFRGDVFEAFFHPDPRMPLYLEYEINQLNKELTLLIPNLNGKVSGWVPWHYENQRRIKKEVEIIGGKGESNAAILSWKAEQFFPYSIFDPLSNVPPISGTTWNANFCRLDYDSGRMIKWAWSPIKTSFHEFEKYGQIVFE